jgi:aerobic C4-dicarboxylate transport protein
MPTRKFYSNLYLQVLAAVVVGAVLGFIAPDRAAAMKPLGDAFIEARSVTHLIGNAVATMVIARWDGALDLERARRVLDGLEGLEGQEGQEVREGLVTPHPPSGRRLAEAAHR